MKMLRMSRLWFLFIFTLTLTSAPFTSLNAKEFQAPQKNGRRYKIADLPDAQRALKESARGWPKWVRKVEEFVSVVAFFSLPFIFQGNTRASVSVNTPNVRVEAGN